MLTHTIRVLSLIGLIAIAHLVKPFSSENVTMVAVATARSVASVLPAETRESLAEAGTLASLVTGGWGGNNLFTNHLTHQVLAFRADFNATDKLEQFPPRSRGKVAVQPRLANKTMRLASKQMQRMERREALQARSQTGWGGAPLPFIPGIEASLMPSTSLMILPQFPMAIPSPAKRSVGIFELRQSVETDCNQASLPEQSWLPEGDWLKSPDEAALPAVTFKVPLINQRPVNGRACPQTEKQPMKGAGRAAAIGRQSC